MSRLCLCRRLFNMSCLISAISLFEYTILFIPVCYYSTIRVERSKQPEQIYSADTKIAAPAMIHFDCSLFLHGMRSLAKSLLRSNPSYTGSTTLDESGWGSSTFFGMYAMVQVGSGTTCKVERMRDDRITEKHQANAQASTPAKQACMVIMVTRTSEM